MNGHRSQNSGSKKTMLPLPESVTPTLPIPISRISQDTERYFLYCANTISWLRREYHILGVLVGTLAQIPQQNVFLGIPLELQPEEARLLVEKEVAYIVDDMQWHRKSLTDMTIEEKEAYRAVLKREGQDLAKASADESRKRSEQALKRRQQQHKGKGTDEDRKHEFPSATVDADGSGAGEEESLFDKPPPRFNLQASMPSSLQPPALTAIPFSITPSSSLSLLPTPPRTPTQALPNVNPASYALFKHLHKEDYFLSPGLRFGCQFLVYPGDPLRFHSHFLAMSAGWDEEIDLLDVVGGGRLGTGVKKSWLIGGSPDSEGEQRGKEPAPHLRAFSVEWGGM